MPAFLKRLSGRILALTLFLFLACPAAAAETRTITDMRGKQVTIPASPERVVTLDDGLSAGVMTALGVQDAVIAVGSHCPVKVFKYSYPTADGKEYSYVDGMNPVGYLNPRLRDVPYMATYGQSTNFEELAALRPDLVFMRVGSCYSMGDSEILQRQMNMIEAMGIPLVVLNGPSTFCDPTVEHISEEIRIVGKAFNKEEQARQLAAYLEGIVGMVRQRTAGVPADQRPSVLLFGLSPKARGEGGAGTAQGRDTIESYFVEDIIQGRNAFEGSGSFSIVNIEQVFAMDPDVVILPTAWGYHPPKELYTAPYYSKLSSLSAVKNHRVVALPWTPCNCAKRLEYPIEIMIMAKAVHPELFKDISIHKWVLEFYKKVYGVDQKTAEGLRTTQWLDWTVEEQW
ncbi:ABC transporter substrate-binding protein [Salidesulfovibrio onnuriiensis]|uniref:ABC transporter substrate-binding protein n=1 Tax=Salidesulfovibrio onnuriiensis TaxID=2583823 RepID=UPI001C9D4762|nr:ABC transporter substrate-binding protein [Salidesulfovibrio onnuriiensis]